MWICRAPSVFSILLLLLRNSSNFKIRIQAAAALAVPATIHGDDSFCAPWSLSITSSKAYYKLFFPLTFQCPQLVTFKLTFWCKSILSSVMHLVQTMKNLFLLNKLIRKCLCKKKKRLTSQWHHWLIVCVVRLWQIICWCPSRHRTCHWESKDRPDFGAVKFEV